MVFQHPLNQAQIQEFRQKGALVLPGFFDLADEILPIQRHIYEIIGLIQARHGLEFKREPFSPETFDSGYQELIAHNRRYGGEVYDAIKQIPAFLRLISNQKSEAVFKQLRQTDLAGIGIASYGIRIDNPHEEKFRSHWHQEFLYQPQSLDGIVFWTPLLTITPELGPVNICLKSHHDGLCTYVKGGPYAQKSGAYEIGIQNPEQVVTQYQQVAPLSQPGDLILMDFLTIHQSGFNLANRSRWAIQGRFFNFHEPTGIQIGWKASATVGTDIETIFSDHFVKD